MYFPNKSFFGSNQNNNKPSQPANASQELLTTFTQNLASQDENIFTFIQPSSSDPRNDDEEPRQSQLFQSQRIHHESTQSQLRSQISFQTSQSQIFLPSQVHSSHEGSLKRIRSQLSQKHDHSSQFDQQNVSQGFDSQELFDAKRRKEFPQEESVLDDVSQDMDVCEILTEDDRVESQKNVSQNSHPEQESIPLYNIIDNNHGGSSIPPSIAQIYEVLLKDDHFDWKFFHVLTGQMCHKHFPMGVYNNLKSALLLSLASTGKGSTPIHIVGIGEQTSDVNVIINIVGKYARSFLNSLNDFGGSKVGSNGVIEGGQLLMAKHGIFYIGDWSGLSSAEVLKLLREVETGKVTMEKIQQSVTLDCAIWTYWSCSKKVKKDTDSIEQFKK